jgi:hypothetical protein
LSSGIVLLNIKNINNNDSLKNKEITESKVTEKTNEIKETDENEILTKDINETNAVTSNDNKNISSSNSNASSNGKKSNSTTNSNVLNNTNENNVENNSINENNNQNISEQNSTNTDIEVSDDIIDTNSWFYSIHQGNIEMSTQDKCLSAGNEIAFIDTVDINYYRCYEVTSTTGKVLGYYLNIFCNSDNCNRYKNQIDMSEYR